jgi:hypothetical protein
MKIVEKSLLAVTFGVAFLGIIHVAPTIVTAILVISICLYLFAGWFLLYPVKSNGTNRLIPFIISYIIAQTITTVIFGINNWPLRVFLSYFTMVINLTAIALIVSLRKSLSSNYPLNGYLVRIIICFMYSCSPIWMKFS